MGTEGAPSAETGAGTPAEGTGSALVGTTPVPLHFWHFTPTTESPTIPVPRHDSHFAPGVGAGGSGAGEGAIREIMPEVAIHGRRSGFAGGAGGVQPASRRARQQMALARADAESP